ncbi:IclR family transcriptional regulator [Halobacillus shinanisalinarum]|uniref:IclR family transcriptional regulator n=1 Tax=Halobacillus shinanisalinarum TaxID=2932258 RepID=A0ABY4GVA8_9BACI|nr:IclR family transcriptional regulator [Halobacillus shinanisalinarum]UOQ91833.1 IclR family transcriptional regulator [Halobacillus shinanisalinarum]
MTGTNHSFSRISAVDNAIDLLLLLSNKSDRSIRELGEELNVTKSTLHRTLQTLEDRGFVKQDRISQKYSLGYKILELSVKLKSQSEIRNLALENMEELRDLIGDTVQLAILEGEQILIIETIEGTKELRIFSKAGQTLPLTYGNFGRVFLSHMDFSKVQTLIEKYPLKQYGSESIVDKETYLNKLKDVKANGISVSIDDPIDGAVSMAVPIFDKAGNVIASLSIVGAKTSQLVENITSVQQLVKNIGLKITEKV